MTTKKTTPKQQALVFKGGSLFSPILGGEITATQELFYKLYRKNTDIKSAVQKIQASVGQSGHYFMKNEEKFEDEKLKMIFKNMRLHKATIIRDLWVGGNAFVFPIKNAFGEMIDMQVLDPRSMTVVADKYGNVVRYIQRSGTNMETYEPEEIFHLVEMKDPDNEILGISRVEALIYDIMGDNEAQISNYAFFKNNATPNMIVILDDGIEDDQYEQTIANMKSQFSGGANRHKVSTSTGIKDIKTIGQSNKDMEFISLRKFTTDKVCAAMSVPLTVLGYHDNVNYSTGDNQYRVFIEETIQHLDDILAGFFTEILHAIYDESVSFYFVDDRNFDRTDRINEYEKMISLGLITINEARTEMWYDTYALENADRPIIKVWFEFVEDIGTTELLPQNQVPNEKMA